MMKPAKPATVAAITDLILGVFRLNGALLQSGDTLVAGLGLTSARWQVLGAIDAAPVALPIAHIARNMGLSRQAVQRLANEMAKDGLVSFAANPHHARAQLVRMTSKGKAAFDAAMKLQRSWATELARGLSPAAISNAARLLDQVLNRLENAN